MYVIEIETANVSGKSHSLCYRKLDQYTCVQTIVRKYKYMENELVHLWYLCVHPFFSFFKLVAVIVSRVLVLLINLSCSSNTTLL